MERMNQESGANSTVESIGQAQDKVSDDGREDKITMNE